MLVIFQEEAEADLEHIGDYIAEDNPRRALSFVQDLRATALKLGEFPNAFPLIPRYERYGIRRRICRDYVIFYTVEADCVAIIQIMHSAQDYQEILFPNG
jgi:addiction module RelE/StbE family toxin